MTRPYLKLEMLRNQKSTPPENKNFKLYAFLNNFFCCQTLLIKAHPKDQAVVPTMAVLHTFRDLSKPLCELIEKVLDQSGSKRTAQRFRRKQHDIFGLTDREWYFVWMYFATYDSVGVTAQLGHITVQKDNRLRDLVRTEEEWQQYLAIREEILLKQSLKDFKAYRRADTHNLVAKRRIVHTPLWRAIDAWERQKGWHMLPVFQERCAGYGGCCARGCGCCLKTYNNGWWGHCTPACGCCQEYYLGSTRPNNFYEYPVRIDFDVRPSRDDAYSRKMVNAYIWGLSNDDQWN
ncbi:hypothetical protein BJX76DRAFT_317851 [Aspergillus varians]